MNHGGGIGAMHWRPMQAGDLAGVVRVARLAFPDHFEEDRCFAERFMLYPRGCFVLAGPRGDVCGYLIAYPWLAGTAPPLNALIGQIPDPADLLYLHDLALLPEARGQGHPKIVIDRLVAQARRDGWRTIALVAVNRAAGFWETFGFHAADTAAMSEKLASYGADARYMLRPIEQGDPPGP